MQKFGKKEAIRFGWDRMKDNLVFYFFVLLLSWILTGGLSAIGRISIDGFYPFFGFSIVSAIFSLFFSIAFIRIGLKIVDGGTPEIADLWASYRVFWKYLGAGILYFLIVLGGLILLIVPGIIWAIKYSFFGFFVVDQNLGPVDAIKASGRITHEAKWQLFLLGWLFFGVILLGALACGVGLFAAIPTVMIATAFVFRKLVAWAPPAAYEPAPAGPQMPPGTTPTGPPVPPQQ